MSLIDTFSFPILVIGIGLWGVLVILILSKKLRDDKKVLQAIQIAALIALFPLIQKTMRTPFHGHMRVTDTFFCPLITILSYALLRYSYKKLFRREPTYNRSSWYDPDDRRNQDLYDVIVFILPVVIGIIFPFLIN